MSVRATTAYESTLFWSDPPVYGTSSFVAVTLSSDEEEKTSEQSLLLRKESHGKDLRLQSILILRNTKTTWALLEVTMIRGGSSGMLKDETASLPKQQ
jgi:hypothetical protein